MKICEQDLSGAKTPPLFLKRFFDLDDQFGPQKNFRAIGHKLRASRRVSFVRNAGAAARTPLDQDLVAVAYQLGHGGGD